MTNKATRQIIEQLKETSHPPIVLLDGDWGIGKTYLIENELRPLIKAESEVFGDYYYISAFGVSSVAEFQDQVISLYTSKQSDTAGYLRGIGKHADKISAMVGANKSEAGLAKGILSGAAGLVRQRLIQKMKGFTLVIDDLERISDNKLIGAILGNCLRFAEHNNIKVIVVANSKALEDKDKVEKVFSDVIRLSREADELLTIVEDIYKGQLDDVLKNCIFEAFNTAESNALDFSNLRVIQRAISRTIKLYNRVKSIDGIDIGSSTDHIAKQIVLISLFCYVQKLGLDSFLSIQENSKGWHEFNIDNHSKSAHLVDEKIKKLSKEKQKQYKLDENFNKLFNFTLPSYNLGRYCFTNIIPDSSDEDLINHFSLFKLSNPIDILTNTSFYFIKSEDDFEEAVSSLEDLLFNASNIKWHEWLVYCDRYLMLLEKGYLEVPCMNEVSEKITRRILNDGVIDLDTVNQGVPLDMRLMSRSINEQYFTDAINEIYTRAQFKNNNAIIDCFLNDWRTTFRMNKDKINSEPFFNHFNTGVFTTAIENWNTIEIAEFIGWLNDRYKNAIRHDIAIQELALLKNLSQQLTRNNQKTNGRLRKGVLNELIEGLNKAVSIIEAR